LTSIEMNALPVLLTIRSEQRFENMDPDSIELMTDGTLTLGGEGELTLSYQESELTGLEGTLTTIQVDGGQATLLNDEGLLTDVQRRWYHYNGNGGDHAENLREAIKVTIHARFPQ